MSSAPTFLGRLGAVILPTPAQIAGSLVVAIIIVAAAGSETFISRLGIPAEFIAATQHQFQERFDAILRLGIASQIALISFWATIGLVAYLICWGFYSILVEARNEVTLNTAYTNRGHWRGPFHTLALKAVSATGLALILSSLWYGVSFWLSLSLQIFYTFTPGTVLAGLGAIIGLALHMYLTLVFAQLTFTPWYRAESFTDA
jgi:hypothetical protein